MFAYWKSFGLSLWDSSSCNHSKTHSKLNTAKLRHSIYVYIQHVSAWVCPPFLFSFSWWYKGFAFDTPLSAGSELIQDTAANNRQMFKNSLYRMDVEIHFFQTLKMAHGVAHFEMPHPMRCILRCGGVKRSFAISLAEEAKLTATSLSSHILIFSILFF